MTLRIREFSNADEATQVRALLEPLDGVRQVVVNRSATTWAESFSAAATSP